MKRNHKPDSGITIVKRSCTTGRAVWIYNGPTPESMRVAYRHAKRMENSRVRWWRNRIMRRARHIRIFIGHLMDAFSYTGVMPNEQQRAIHQLQILADNPPPCDTGFYNHLRREQKRQKKDREERLEVS